MKRYNMTFFLDTNKWEKNEAGKYYSQSFVIGDWYKVDLQPSVEQVLQLQKDDIKGLYTYIDQGKCWVCTYNNYPSISMTIPGILWEKKNNLNITYDANGGVFLNNRKTINDTIYKMEDGKIVPSAILCGHQEPAHRDGYYFSYWSPINSSNEPTGDVFELNEDIYRDVYLKAVWEKEAGTLLEKQTWYLGTTDKTLIKEIQIIDDFKDNGDYLLVESWNADTMEELGRITCYIHRDDSDYYRLTIAGNGAGHIILSSDASETFSGFTGITNISGLEIFDSSRTQSMKGMFMNCSSLISLSLRGLKFDIVTDLMNFCSGCSSLTTIEFDNAAAANRLIKIIAMFKGCSNLTSIIFPIGFDFSKVLAASFAFYGCEKLSAINFPNNYNFNKITQINSMFYNCYSLISLDLRGFNTSNIILESNYRNFLSNTALYNFSIGENWGINFTDVGLASPTFNVSDGYWYDSNTNIGYEVYDIPVNVNATYTAVAPTA